MSMEDNAVHENNLPVCNLRQEVLFSYVGK